MVADYSFILNIARCFGYTAASPVVVAVARWPRRSCFEPAGTAGNTVAAAAADAALGLLAGFLAEAA